MLATRHVHLEWELLKWLALVALAGAIALAMASQTAGQTRESVLPAELGPPAGAVAEPTPTASAVEIWMALEYHREGDLVAAIHAWEGMRLAPQVDVWRHVALSSAYLRVAEPGLAEDTLRWAAYLQPDNAAVAYFEGVLRLVQADEAQSWTDALVANRAVGVCDLPEVPAWYEEAARRSFERALERAPALPLETPLAGVEWGSDELDMPVVPPTVADLLGALGAENFEGRAHYVAGDLSLRIGDLPRAEEHLDQAAETGIRIVYGYEDLGEKYADRGQHGDAARAYLKATTQGHGVVGPGSRALEQLLKMFRE